MKSFRTLVAFALAAALSAAPLAAEAYLVEDIGQGRASQILDSVVGVPAVYGGLPNQLHRLGDRLVFVALTLEHGFEPWVSDGTEEGTFLLADLCPGDCGSWTRILGPTADDRLLLAGRTADEGGACRLWSTDGRSVEPVGAATYLGLCGPNDPEERGLAEPAPGIPFEGHLLFSHLFEIDRRGLSRSDGTSEGTEEVALLCPAGGVCAVELLEYETFRDSLYYVTGAPGNPRPAPRLWRLDDPLGTPEVVATACPDSASPLANLTTVDDLLFFSGCLLVPGVPASGHHLYAIGADGEIELVHPLAGLEPDSLVAGDGVVWFLARGEEDAELWRSDGTAAGTVRVHPRLRLPRDARLHRLPDGTLLVQEPMESIVPFEEPAFLHAILEGALLPLVRLPGPTDVTVIGGLGYFAGWSEEHGAELWVTDGTLAGTRRLTDVNPDEADAWPGPPVRVADRLFFSAIHGVAFAEWDDDRVPDEIEGFGRELWALPVAADGPIPAPPGEWLGSTELPGFRYQARITPPGGAPVAGTDTLPCPEDTACLAGQVPDRPELFLRVLGPRGNGYLWPTVVRFTPSEIEIWLERPATGELRYYRLPAVGPGMDGLPGLQDRTGFEGELR